MKFILNYLQQHKRLTLSLSIAWTLLIFIGCSLPGRELPKVNLFQHMDKVVHLSFFMLFFIFWYCYLKPSSYKAQMLIVVSIVFGFAIEFYQLHCVAGRSFDVWDGVADGVGAILSWALVAMLHANKH